MLAVGYGLIGAGLGERLAFEPDVITIGDGVILFNLGKYRRLAAAPLIVNEGGLANVSFSPDGKILAVGYGLLKVGDVNADPAQVVGLGGKVLWDFTTYKPHERRSLKRMEKSSPSMPEGDVKCIAFSPDGTTLATAYGVEGSVMLWDVAKLVPVGGGPLQVPGSHVNSVAFSHDGKKLAVGYGPNGKTLASAGNIYHGGVVLWNVATRERPVKDTVLFVPEGGVRDVAFSPHGNTLAARYSVGFGGGGGVVLWNIASLKQPMAQNQNLIPESAFGGLAFSPDGKILAAGKGP